MSDFRKYFRSSGKQRIKAIVTSVPHMVLGAAIFFRLMRQNGKTHYLICNPVLGDAMFALSYLREFKRQRGIDHVTVICTNYTKRICDYFSGVVDDVICKKRWKYGSLKRFYDTRIGQYYFGVYMDRITFVSPYRFTNSLWDNQVMDYSMFVKAMLFKINLSTKPDRPSIPKADISKLLEKYKINKGRTVLLNSVANSVLCDVNGLLAALVRDLKRDGYDVVTLTANETEQPVRGTRAVPCTLEEAFSLVEYGGTLIGLRSGFMDVMVYACCKIIAINDEAYGLKSLFSLESLGVNPDCHSIIYDGDDEESKREIAELLRLK